jgi:hypothetical protein
MGLPLLAARVFDSGAGTCTSTFEAAVVAKTFFGFDWDLLFGCVFGSTIDRCLPFDLGVLTFSVSFFSTFYVFSTFFSAFFSTFSADLALALDKLLIRLLYYRLFSIYSFLRLFSSSRRIFFCSFRLCFSSIRASRRCYCLFIRASDYYLFLWDFSSALFLFSSILCSRFLVLASSRRFCHSSRRLTFLMLYIFRIFSVSYFSSSS